MNVTTLNLLEELFPPEFQGITAPKGYFWKVVSDPTRNDEEPGLFYGSMFRLLDIIPTKDEPSPWPDGIVFQHINTGQRLTFKNGQAQFLNLPDETVKRQHRNQKDKHVNGQTRQGLEQKQSTEDAGAKPCEISY